MRKCVVCGARSSQWCGGCGNVSYCGVKHQKQHWPQHRSQCGTVKTCNSPLLGNYLVAARDLRPGDLILDEDVSVLGPAGEEEDEEVCVSCYYPSHGHTCPLCTAPLCGPSCLSDPASPHCQECSTLASFNINTNTVNIIPFITPLRFILLSKTDPKRYKKCRELSTNIEQRREQPDFQLVKDKAAAFCSLFPGLSSEEEMVDILCILDTNTFQVLSSGSARSLAGLYLRVSLLNHNCVPNCRLIFRADSSLQVRASVEIKRGQQVNISYTPPFFSLIARNNILHRGKQFLCSCSRCQDPSELGTNLSSLRCEAEGCQEEPGLFQHTGSFSQDWECSSCKLRLTYQQYAALDAKYLGLQTRLDKENVDEMKDILRKHSTSLSPNHALIMETKQHLAAALGRVDGYRVDQLSEQDLDLKISISYDLLRLLDVLEPGISKSRGITLLDLAEARVRKILKTESNFQLVADQLAEVELELAEADNILQYEDEKALEGNVAKKARLDLADIRKYLQSLRPR